MSKTKQKRQRWAVTAIPNEHGSPTYRVHRADGPEWDYIAVWESGGKFGCCGCSGPLSAMLSTCAHARAAKRFALKTGDAPTEPK